MMWGTLYHPFIYLGCVYILETHRVKKHAPMRPIGWDGMRSVRRSIGVSKRVMQIPGLTLVPEGW